MPPRFEILLVSGLHPNEACAPLIAHEVFAKLSQRGVSVAHYEVPYACTLVALIDDPGSAVPDYSMPAGGRVLDVDLDGLDELLRQRYPGSLVFEFHNAEDTHPMLGIDPRKPVECYAVGTLGPDLKRGHEIATWRNVDGQGRPGKYLIELPARYVHEDSSLSERRRQRLAALRASGYEYDPRWSHYLERRADIEASRQKGYLDDCVAAKVADWIMKEHGE